MKEGSVEYSGVQDEAVEAKDIIFATQVKKTPWDYFPVHSSRVIAGTSLIFTQTLESKTLLDTTSFAVRELAFYICLAHIPYISVQCLLDWKGTAKILVKMTIESPSPEFKSCLEHSPAMWLLCP